MARSELRLPPHLLPLFSRLQLFFAREGGEAYVAGGFLRDLLLERPPNDIDISIAGDPLEVAPRLAVELDASHFPLDSERRHVRLLLPELDAHIDLIPRRGTIENDLRLRDYTIDALGARLPELASGAAPVIDPTGGISDLRAGLLRAVSRRSLTDDPLRMLRGVRLAAQLAFDIEAETAGMIRESAPSIGQAAVERQSDELLMILASARAAAALRRADELGLLSHVLPELDEMRGVEQPKQHHWDVFNHGIEAVGAMDVILAPGEPADPFGGKLWRELWGGLSWWGSARERWAEETSPGIPRFAVMKLCALLHDIGKPRTKTVEASGRIRFFGHSEAGAAVAEAVLRRLRFPSAVVSDVTSMISAHLRPLQIAQFGPPSRRAVYRFFRDTGAAGPGTLFLSLADHLATAGPRVTAAGWQRHVAVVDYLLRMSVEPRAVGRAPGLLTGDDIMRDLGLEPGRRVGELLELVREAHSVGEISSRDEALDLARRHLERNEKRS